jgi:arsenite methyltransferase
MTAMAKAPDRWHRWLMDERFGGDPAARERLLAELLYPVRDTVLDKAGLQPGDTLLDVGTGGGPDRLRRAGTAQPGRSRGLLRHLPGPARSLPCGRAAEGLLDRCRFLASADSLERIADASVDVVTTRSVLIYVTDKAEALQAFYRVLRPGGRISVFEPIGVLIRDRERLLGYDITPVKPLAAKIGAFYQSIQPPGPNPMLDFDERDLVRHAEQAGFADISLASP